MTKRVSASQAKAQLSELVAEVAYRGVHVIIERRGKPQAALVSISDLERLGRAEAPARSAAGALALVGAWADVPEEELDRIVADIYAQREKYTGQPVELEP